MQSSTPARPKTFWLTLEAEGYSVEVVENGEDALTRLLDGSESFDALVLDIMLPGMDGFAVAHHLREAKNFIPLLMLTALGRPEDVLRGFEAGADDYLPKPFNLDILLARIASLLRRKQWMQTAGTTASNTAAESPATELESFSFDGRIVDFQKLQLRAREQTFQLTLMEVELLRYLIRNSGRPVSRKEILEQVCDLHEDTA